MVSSPIPHLLWSVVHQPVQTSGWVEFTVLELFRAGEIGPVFENLYSDANPDYRTRNRPASSPGEIGGTALEKHGRMLSEPELIPLRRGGRRHRIPRRKPFAHLLIGRVGSKDANPTETTLKSSS